MAVYWGCRDRGEPIHYKIHSILCSIRVCTDYWAYICATNVLSKKYTNANTNTNGFCLFQIHCYNKSSTAATNSLEWKAKPQTQCFTCTHYVVMGDPMSASMAPKGNEICRLYSIYPKQWCICSTVKRDGKQTVRIGWGPPCGCDLVMKQQAYSDNHHHHHHQHHHLHKHWRCQYDVTFVLFCILYSCGIHCIFCGMQWPSYV